MIYKETYKNLSHGTDEESAKKIKENGFEIRGGCDSWCGKGIYFYDVKKKSWWAANRKCTEIKRKTGVKIKPFVLFADIIDLSDDEIFDMRIYENMCDFERTVRPFIGKCSMQIANIQDETEKVIKLRTMLISYYILATEKKLVIGNFKQRPQKKYEHIMEFAESLDILFGIETIYCVKDKNIIKNVR